MPSLPCRRQLLDQRYTVVRSNEDKASSWRDEYLSLNAAQFRRVDVACSESLCMPLTGGRAEDDKRLRVAKSWIRVRECT